MLLLPLVGFGISRNLIICVSVKKILLIVLILIVFSCCNKQNAVKQSIPPVEAIIPIQAIKTDSICLDIISITWVNQDSLDYIKFKKDSTNFRKMTKIINGGYNGFADRYKLWLRARKALNKQNKK